METGTNQPSFFKFEADDFFLYEGVCTPDPTMHNSEWIIILVCLNGTFQIQLDGKFIKLGKNDIVFAIPDRTLQTLMISPDFYGRLFGCSSEFARRIFPNSADLWHKALYLHQNLKIHFEEEEIAELETDYQYFRSKITQTGQLYYKNMMYCLSQAFLYHMAGILDRVIKTSVEDGELQSRNHLCKAFLDLLIMTRPRPRSVTWYSNRLHVTPKYLSAAVKQDSGKTVSEWIRRVVVSEIADLLKNSPMSIKEICVALDFPNLSFFGRYVRTHLGVSPKAYREQNSRVKPK